MPTVFDQEIHVTYWQFSVESYSGGAPYSLNEYLGGQANGLCGAAAPGLLLLITGIHSGSTSVTVDVLDAPAPIGDEWEDVVEVSFRPASMRVALVQWSGTASWALPLALIDYRVRDCATGMDQARQKDTLRDGEPLLDRYLLQLWPTPPTPDAVIRETSQCAASSHAHARTLPSPPRPRERAEATRRERPAREARRWGGRPPDEGLRRIHGGEELAQLDRALVDGIAALDPATERAVAIWAARRACATSAFDRPRLGETDTRRTRARGAAAICRPRRGVSPAARRSPCAS